MMKFPTEWKNKKCSKPPTRQVVNGLSVTSIEKKQNFVSLSYFHPPGADPVRKSHVAMEIPDTSMIFPLKIWISHC